MWTGEGETICSTVGSSGESRAVGQAGWEPPWGEEPALALFARPAPRFPLQVHCISTEFTPRKHGGEKGVPFRVQIDTFKQNENGEYTEHLHSASCQIKVFKVGWLRHARQQSVHMGMPALPRLRGDTETFSQFHLEVRWELGVPAPGLCLGSCVRWHAGPATAAPSSAFAITPVSAHLYCVGMMGVAHF